MLRALVIDDDCSARAQLIAALGLHPGVTVLGQTAAAECGQKLLEAADYDLVFLDIPFDGGIAFELVEHVRPGAHLVFVTAHEQHARRAFEVNALDYLLKPVAPARLKEALTRVIRAHARAPAQVDESSGPALRLEDGVYLHNGRHARLADLAHISAIRADDNYSEVLLFDGARILMRKSLSSWEIVLPPSHFMRVHRTSIVNLARVVRYERDGDEHTRLYVEGVVEPLPASRSRWTELRSRLRALKRPL